MTKSLVDIAKDANMLPPDLTIWIDGGCRRNGQADAETYFSGLIRGRKDTSRRRRRTSRDVYRLTEGNYYSVVGIYFTCIYDQPDGIVVRGHRRASRCSRILIRCGRLKDVRTIG